VYRLLGYLDGPAVCFDDRLDDDHAQPRPTVCGRVADLEHLIVDIRRDSNAIVLHVEPVLRLADPDHRELGPTVVYL